MNVRSLTDAQYRLLSLLLHLCPNGADVKSHKLAVAAREITQAHPGIIDIGLPMGSYGRWEARPYLSACLTADGYDALIDQMKPGQRPSPMEPSHA